MRPFASKTVSGGKLFRRKHGFNSETILAGTTGIITLIVPYTAVKINELEFLNCSLGDKIELSVLDTPDGDITLKEVGVALPNHILNKFGFGVYMPHGYYSDISNYDADLFLGMQIEIEYKNNSAEDKTILGNIIWHEVKVI
jgi:hypothetical protein